MPLPPDEAQWRGQIKAIVGEIAAMEYAGEIRGIAAVVIDKDGDMRTLIGWGNKLKFPLVAGTAFLQHELVVGTETFDKKRNL